MYKFLVSLRYLRKKRITFIAAAGVAVGVLALVVVLSVMSGFDREIRSRIRGTLADITIESPMAHGVSNYEEYMKQVKAVPHVTACAPYVDSVAVMKIGTARVWGKFRGIDPVAEAAVSDFENYMCFNRPADFSFPKGVEPDRAPAIVGLEMVRLRERQADQEDRPEDFVQDGQQIVIVTVKQNQIDPSIKPFTIVGKFKAHVYDFDSGYAYVPLRDAQTLLGAKDSVTGISVKLDDYKNARLVKMKLMELFGPMYLVQTWEEKRAIFLAAVAIERKVMAVILFFIVLVAGFCIFAILHTIVLEKAKDIGILKALGGTPRGIMSIFVLTGFLIGTMGALAGMSLGLVFIRYINDVEALVKRQTGWTPFPPNIYYLDKIPSEVNPTGICAIVLVAILCSLLFSLYPAYRAARLDPVETLRYE
ncbi:MAG: FtsX-like permease family protein [Planctomycetes bacterium]|nr:FtsX-like permease family protein [Planctomycetota bacterium]MBM4084729.1 FtsX-like permease family protein [Planctomycetota bacterium]